jgi:GTP-binding protein
MNPNPLYFRTEFLLSVPTPQGAPPDEGREVAFAGRSNAGKSSVINTITRRKNLARTSKTPGRTQAINFFQVDEHCRLVDLPGYGYAKVSKDMRGAWGRAMEDYLRHRQALQGVFLIMDIRHPLTDFDWQMADWCAHDGLALHLVLTKADKLSRGAAASTLLQVRRSLQAEGVDASAQTFSAVDRTGLEEAHSVLDQWLQPVRE